MTASTHQNSLERRPASTISVSRSALGPLRLRSRERLGCLVICATAMLSRAFPSPYLHRLGLHPLSHRIPLNDRTSGKIAKDLFRLEDEDSEIARVEACEFFA